MAHFVEHSFFLGSRKFPYPNQLFRLILPHDGYTNAYTGGLQTMYTISTSLEIFALALEMLGDGVGFPLLPKDLVAKEIDALDAEYSLRIDDIPKYNQLLASLAKENHPLR
jgi:secreted Zn-dependent insulinase-like peptidase